MRRRDLVVAWQPRDRPAEAHGEAPEPSIEHLGGRLVVGRLEGAAIASIVAWSTVSRIHHGASHPQPGRRGTVVRYARGVEQRFLIRTFGCQMNEHDSERIGGVLMADGMVADRGSAEARVIVLNTCAIRENADNKLYGNLGHLKPLKAANPSLKIVVAGCLAQKDQGVIQRKAPWVDVVVGTHSLPQLLDLLRRVGDARVRSSTSKSTQRPSPARSPPRAATPSARGCRSRLAVTTRARSASSPWSAVRSGRARSARSSPRCSGSSPTASWRSRCSVRTSTPMAVTSRSRARPGGRSSRSSCGRSTRWTVCGRSGSRPRIRTTSRRM